MHPAVKSYIQLRLSGWSPAQSSGAVLYNCDYNWWAAAVAVVVNQDAWILTKLQRLKELGLEEEV